MSQTLLYPLRFEPIYQYRLWGGRRLADLLTPPLPSDGPNRLRQADLPQVAREGLTHESRPFV